MKLIRSRKRELSDKWIERADYHDDLAKRLEDDGEKIAADMASVVANVFRLCSEELRKI